MVISIISNTILTFNFSYTKASLVASIIFVLDKKTDLISAPHALVYFGIVIFFVYFKVSTALFFSRFFIEIAIAKKSEPI